MKPSSAKIPDILTAALFCLIPLVFTYRATHYFILKTASLQVFAFALLTLRLIKFAGKTPATGIRAGRIDIPVLCFLSWSGLSVIWAQNRYLALEELVFLTSLAAVYYVISKTNTPLKLISKAVSLAAVTASGYGIFQFLGLDFLNPRPAQMVSTFGNVNFAGEYIAASLFFTAGLFLEGKKKEKIVYGSAGALQLVYLVITGARGGWVGLFGGGIILFFILGPRIRTARAISFALGGLAVSLLFVRLIGGAQSLDAAASRAYSIFNIHHPSVQVRLHVWRSMLEMIKQNPLAGVGAGNFQIVFPLFRPLEELRISGIVTQVARAHNDYLEIAADLGIIGLGLFAWLLAETVKTLKNRKCSMDCAHACCAAGVVCILTSALFGFPLKTPSTALLFWGGLGILSRPGAERKKKREMPAHPGLMAGGAVVLLIFAVLHTSAWFMADAHLKKAMEHENAKNWQKMERELKTSIKYYYPNIQSHNRLAGAYIFLGDLENTYASLQSLLELHPNHAWAHRALGQIYIELNQKEKGFELLHRSAELNPVFISFLGRAYLQSKDLPAAEHYLHKQIKQGFADELSYTYLGELYEAKGEPERAARAYERALKINPEAGQAAGRLRVLQEQTEPALPRPGYE